MQESRALMGLNEAQRYAVSLGAGPILVIAGAGSGKTRTLVHRVAHLVETGAEPGSILLLTFTRRAAGEMLSRARELSPQAARVEGGTFHSLAHRLLRAHGHHLGLRTSFTILDQADCEQIMKGVVEELGLKKKGDRLFPKASTLVDINSRSRNLERDIMEFVEEQMGHLLPFVPAMLTASRAFVQAKADQGLLDYDDLLFFAERLLRDFPQVRASLHQRWRHVLVDEYQDTNAVQARLVELLAGPQKNVMAVGDDAQSIYRFRGARVQNILDFPARFAGTRLVKLEQNYRSTQPILDLTNQIIAQAARHFEKHLYTEQGGGPRPRLLRPRDDKGQSRAVVGRMRELIAQGVPPEQLAVLFRTSNDSYDLELELASQGLSYVKFGGRRFLEAAHIKDALAHLRVLANPRDYLSWQRLLQLLPGVGPKKAQALMAQMTASLQPSQPALALAGLPASLGGEGLAALAALMERLSAPGLEPLEAMEAVLAYYEPICRQIYEDHPRRLRDLGELPGLARQHETLAELMAEVALDPPATRADEQGPGRVTLSTIHSAKGLEWRHVFLLWACDGRLPAFPAFKNAEEIEEERRLMYVACTRARESLTLLAPRESYNRDRGLVSLELSRFLAEVDPALVEGDPEAPVFQVPEPGPVPASRGALQPGRPFAVGQRVSHASFGAGKVMGYKGQEKILVHFDRFGLKILLLSLAKLQPA